MNESQMRELNQRISQAGSTHELLRLAEFSIGSLNHIHAGNLWNKLGKQPDVTDNRHHQQVGKLLRRSMELIDMCSARQLANIAHGVAKCRVQEVNTLYAAIAEAAVRGGLGGFNPQNLANIAWAFATVGVRADALYAAIAEAAVRGGLGGFKPQELSNTAWAFATAGVRADALYAAIAEAAVRGGLGGFKPQDLSNTAWAFATACVSHPKLFTELANAVPLSMSTSPLCWGADRLSQLHLWQLQLTFQSQGSDSQLLSREVRQRCHDAMQSFDVHASQLQHSVAFALAKLHAGFEEEVIDERTGYSLDLALSSSLVAVEVDGPMHFLRNLGTQGGWCLPTGSTVLKRRLLCMAGWRVLSVPFYEWDPLTDLQAQCQYLKSRLGELDAAASAPTRAAAASSVGSTASVAVAPAVTASTLVAGPTSLLDIVMSALHAYAIEQGHLESIGKTQGWRYDVHIAGKVVKMAARQITASLEQRGETKYSLVQPNGRPIASRVDSVHHYFVKAVRKLVESRKLV